MLIGRSSACRPVCLALAHVPLAFIGAELRTGVQRTPALGHAIGTQGIHAQAAHLQGVVAKGVGHGLLELGLFPVAQVTARRGIEPIVHERGGSYNHRRLPLRLAAAASRALI